MRLKKEMLAQQRQPIPLRTTSYVKIRGSQTSWDCDRSLASSNHVSFTQRLVVGDTEPLQGGRIASPGTY